MSDGKDTRPEAEHPEEALLWSAWAADLPAGDAVELDEEILGLLDGTSRGEAAMRARRRLAEEPRLARAFGELAAEARSLDSMPRVAAPGPRIAEARELVSGGEPTPARGPFAFLRELFSSPTPAVLAAAAAVLLVAVVLRAPGPEQRPEVRANGAGAGAVEIFAPPADATIHGDVRFQWRSVPGARSYRVVLMDVTGGAIDELGATESTGLRVPAGELAQRFGSDARTLHWVVRARLADGTEVTSSPARIHWSADPAAD